MLVSTGIDGTDVGHRYLCTVWTRRWAVIIPFSIITLISGLMLYCGNNKTLIEKTVDLNDRDFLIGNLYKYSYWLVFLSSIAIAYCLAFYCSFMFLLFYSILFYSLITLATISLYQPFSMNLTKDILLLAHYSIMFDECCKFMFLSRHVSSIHLLDFIVFFYFFLFHFLFLIFTSTYVLFFCNRHYTNAIWWWWWWWWWWYI